MVRKLWLSLVIAAAPALLVLAVSATGFGLQPISFVHDRPMLTASGALPAFANADAGATAASTISVHERGAAAAALVLDLSANGSAALRHAVDLEIRRADGATVYRGPLLPTLRLHLGSIGEGDSRDYRLQIVLSRDAPEAASGKRVSLAASWTATA